MRSLTFTELAEELEGYKGENVEMFYGSSNANMIIRIKTLDVSVYLEGFLTSDPGSDEQQRSSPMIELRDEDVKGSYNGILKNNIESITDVWFAEEIQWSKAEYRIVYKDGAKLSVNVIE